MKQTRYCEKCDKDTQHDDECIRDASVPPDGLNEGYCTSEEAIFYGNGDSIYRVTCLECGISHEEC